MIHESVMISPNALEVHLQKEISAYSFIVIKVKCKTEEQMEIVTISQNKWNKAMPVKWEKKKKKNG